MARPMPRDEPVTTATGFSAAAATTHCDCFAHSPRSPDPVDSTLLVLNASAVLTVSSLHAHRQRAARWPASDERAHGSSACSVHTQQQQATHKCSSRALWPTPHKASKGQSSSTTRICQSHALRARAVEESRCVAADMLIRMRWRTVAIPALARAGK